MKSKERIKRTLAFKETDRIPFGIFGTSAANEARLAKELKMSSVEQMHQELELDIWHLFQPLEYAGETREYRGMEADFWGVPLDVGEYGDSGIYHPLAEITSVDEVEAYKFPNIDDFDSSWLDKELEKHNNFAIEGGLWAPIFHNVTWLCGLENTLCNLITDPEMMKLLIKKVTDFWIGYARKVLETAKGRVMIMQNCNDFGTQRDLLISAEMFREFFKPELKRLYDAIKEFDVAVLQHSCGAVSSIIGDFIEIGADIMNPVQVSAAGMDIDSIVKKFGGKVTFYGGIDTQWVLPTGSEEKIRRTVRDTIGKFDMCKGYILAPSQGVEADISAQNLKIMFDEGKRYCKFGH